jgi:hypothetical protein
MTDDDPRGCDVNGCLALRRPMCVKHWFALQPRARYRIEQLEEEGYDLAYRIALGLAAEELELGRRRHERRRAWAGLANTHFDRQRRQERATLERIRSSLVELHPFDYHARTSAPREQLAALVEAVDAESAIAVAWLMVRRGLGVAAYDPVWIAAALDLDEDRELGEPAEKSFEKISQAS